MCLNKEKEADLYYRKLELIVGSNLSTGIGTSYEDSFFTLSPSDGQEIVNWVLQQKICSMGSGNDENGNFHEILGIQLEDQEDCVKLYFNIEHASKRMFGPEGLKMGE